PVPDPPVPDPPVPSPPVPPLTSPKLGGASQALTGLDDPVLDQIDPIVPAVLRELAVRAIRHHADQELAALPGRHQRRPARVTIAGLLAGIAGVDQHRVDPVERVTHGALGPAAGAGAVVGHAEPDVPEHPATPASASGASL